VPWQDLDYLTPTNLNNWGGDVVNAGGYDSVNLALSAATTSGISTVLLPAATYAIGSPLTVPAGFGIVGMGYGSVLSATSIGGPIVDLNGDYTSLRNVRIASAATANVGTSGDGIRVVNDSAYYVIDNVWVNGARRGILVTGSTPGTAAYGRISNAVITNCKGHGFEYNVGGYSTIENITLDGNTEQQFVCSTTGGNTLAGLNIRGIVASNPVMVSSVGNNIQLTQCIDSVLDDVTGYNAANDQINLLRCERVTVGRHALDSNLTYTTDETGAGVQIEDSLDVSVGPGSVYRVGGESGGAGYSADSSLRVTFTGCNSRWNAKYGYFVQNGSAFATLVDCTASYNSSAGFYISQDDATLVACSSSSNTGHGFHFANNKRVTINACQAYRNGQHGILLEGVNKVSLTGCRAIENATGGDSTHHGIRILGGDSNSSEVQLVNCIAVNVTESVASQGYGLVVNASQSSVRVIGGVYEPNRLGDFSDNGTDTFSMATQALAGI
jgi:hypothetical protein